MFGFFYYKNRLISNDLGLPSTYTNLNFLVIFLYYIRVISIIHIVVVLRYVHSDCLLLSLLLQFKLILAFLIAFSMPLSSLK